MTDRQTDRHTDRQTDRDRPNEATLKIITRRRLLDAVHVRRKSSELVQISVAFHGGKERKTQTDRLTERDRQTKRKEKTDRKKASIT